jgi:ABC-type polysaccharide/polyol phosphate export permease
MIQHLTAIWKFRHFLFALVKLDLRLRYRRSILGVGWSLLNPIAMTIVFTVVFSSLLGGGDIPRYVPHLLIGMAVWNFLRECTVSGCRALIGSECYIRQSPLPYGIYPLRTVFGQAIHSAIALVVAVGVTFAYRPETSLLAFAYILPGIVLAFITAWAAATIFAFVNVYFQDTQHLLEVGAQIVFFMSPIIYYSQNLIDKGMGWLVDINPVHLFLELIRAPLVSGQPPTVQLLLTGVAFTGIMVGLAAGTTAWLQKRVIFHL